jgi:putative transposase
LGLSRTRIYALKKPKENKMAKKDETNSDAETLKLIQDLVRQFPFYGYRKITAILRYQRGLTINRKKVYALMKANKLCLAPSTSQKKLFRGIPFSHKTQAEKSNELWGIDMTYIWCGEEGWAYMHAVIDHHDKELLGYHFSRSCSSLGGVMALADAASKRQVENLELRSDNGCHYGAKLFRDELKRLGINHTRTMVNTPKGNSVVERLFKSLKEECVWQNQFRNFEEAKAAVDQWVTFYNSERPHQSLGYETPQRFYQKKQQQSLRSVA